MHGMMGQALACLISRVPARSPEREEEGRIGAVSEPRRGDDKMTPKESQPATLCVPIKATMTRLFAWSTPT